jgi:predicted PurR-regulated permease PerM
MSRTQTLTAPANSVALWTITVVAMLFFLQAARSLMIPVAVAVIISYALAPVVTWLEHRRVPTLLGAGFVILVVLALCGAGVYALRDDAALLASDAPKAAERARELLRSMFGSGAQAIEQASKETASGGSGPLQSIAGGIFSFAGHFVVVVFLIYFLLISGHHVRNRLIEIAGRHPESRRTVSTIIDDINVQIQRYLLVLLVTAIVVGVSTWLVLLWIGARQAAMWGVLAGLFNSIPYFGPVVVTGGLFVVGVVQGGITQALQMAGASLVITSLEGWLLTPALMGKAERMSALAVFLGLLLWTWVWGVWGTLLAVPMLAVIKSVADHVDALKPLGRLMAP